MKWNTNCRISVWTVATRGLVIAINLWSVVRTANYPLRHSSYPSTLSSQGFLTQPGLRADYRPRPEDQNHRKWVKRIEKMSERMTTGQVTLGPVCTTTVCSGVLVRTTSFCCRSSSFMRISLASARAALFAASLASAWGEREWVRVTGQNEVQNFRTGWMRNPKRSGPWALVCPGLL